MNDTKERILEVSLELFSQHGYSAVSIRDICKEVGVKESSIYYHFKNKQAIFEELLSRFREKAHGLVTQFEQALSDMKMSFDNNCVKNVCDSFFEKYLMDDFCNKVMRLLLIEQLNNEEAHELYDYWVFEKPIEFQSSIFERLSTMGLLLDGNSRYIALKYYAPLFFYAQKWLFSGVLTDESKNAFRLDAYAHIQLFFGELFVKPEGK